MRKTSYVVAFFAVLATVILVSYPRQPVAHIADHPQNGFSITRPDWFACCPPIDLRVR